MKGRSKILFFLLPILLVGSFYFYKKFLNNNIEEPGVLGEKIIKKGTFTTDGKKTDTTVDVGSLKNIDKVVLVC